MYIWKCIGFFILRFFRDRVYIGVFMCEREQIGGSTTTVANDDWNRRFIVYVNQNGLNGVCTAFDYQTHEWYCMMIVKCDFNILTI